MYRKYSLTACLLISCMMMPLHAFAEGEGASEGGGAGDAPMVQTQHISSVQGQSTSYSSPFQQRNDSARKNGPRTHQVVNGDTLWDLSATYMADPFKWPALWSFNPQVTNPHWIYPGDTIYLEPSAASADLTTVPASPVSYNASKTVGRGVIVVPGFYVSELPESRGHILYSEQEKHLLTMGDEVNVDWVDIEMRKKYSIGQRFTVFEQSPKPIYDENGDKLAYKLIRTGEIELIDVQPEMLSTARIINATREIERGNLIIPNNDLVFSTQRTANTKSMEGRVIDTIDVLDQLATNQFVIINRGSQDGVVPGNRWIVFEQREGLDYLPQGEGVKSEYNDDDDDDDKKDPRDGTLKRETTRTWVLGHPPNTPQYPKREYLDEVYEDREYTTDDLPLRKIGEILVVDTKDKFCTGIITSTIREVVIDTRVVMIKGF